MLSTAEKTAASVFTKTAFFQSLLRPLRVCLVSRAEHPVEPNLMALCPGKSPVRRIEMSAVTVRIPTASNSVQSDIGDEHGNHAPFMPISSRFKNLAARRTQVSGFGYNLDSRHFTCF